MDEKKKIIEVVTHSGSFHTDEVFALATLELYYEKTDQKLHIVRTRDEAVIAKADMAVYVGNVYDAEKQCFDHHQKGGAGVRDNGVPYSSFGLIWKHFGEDLCGSVMAAKHIEEKLVFPVDAADMGVNTYSKTCEFITPYILHNIIEVFRPTWKESENGKTFDDGFFEMLEIAKMILKREIIGSNDYEEGVTFVREAYDKAEDKRVIILDGHYPWEQALSEYPEPLLVVKSDIEQSNNWKIKTVKIAPQSSFEDRKSLPKAWGGLRGEELVKVTGVEDAIFCHTKLFIAVAGSKEGALALAQLALENED